MQINKINYSEPLFFPLSFYLLEQIYFTSNPFIIFGQLLEIIGNKIINS